MRLENSVFHKTEAAAPLPPLILLHGLLGRGRNLARLARDLSDLCDVYCFDLRGHGASPHGRASIDAWSDDIIETCTDLGLGSVSLLGHSVGGKVAMNLCLRENSSLKIESLIVGDMAPSPSVHGNRELLQRLAALQFPELKTRSQVGRFLESIVHSPELAAWLGQNIEPGVAPRWTIDIHALVDGISRLESWPEGAGRFDDYSRWDGRALFQYGDKSSYVREREKTAIRRFFPNAEIKAVEEAGHWLHVERYDAFLENARRFLMQNSGTR